MNAADATEDRVATLHSLLNEAAKKVGEQRLRIDRLELALSFVARMAWTKPELTMWEALAAIAYHPDVKEIVERWKAQEPEGQRHWKLRDFKASADAERTGLPSQAPDTNEQPKGISP